MVKLLAFHLPQYHAFKENDEWWGKGFTDWNNVKKAQPLYEGHYQPRVPIDGYYNMLDKETHIRQAQLAKEYGIYGFCYYHYWFGGKILMEKPMEMVLNEKDIDFPYCICWANEPWTRSWDGKNREIIMPQIYGEQKDWQVHLEYLLPFFKDERYIKIDNKPLFVIYRTNEIKCCDEMIDYWNQECIKNGFNGIYICEERNAFQKEASCKNSNAILNFEPGYTRSLQRNAITKTYNFIKRKLGSKYIKESYSRMVMKISSRPIPVSMEKKEFIGAFSGWDNTPRRKTGGIISIGTNPHKFEKLLQTQIEKSNKNSSEFLFINAWNEWAEGAYLEPDNKFGYGYLQAVKNAVKKGSI